ncbi:uncharacterized protein EI97DRAFT_191694 [Westerdykella ornata]|uniref:Uncharacterized protein n=1 Tax=Westerdykella ornata TaxID=318751 RepID=A0A6A6J8U1_WESOR|nr:uncharacterized protein EI97DRAFT_191694 [Westerdykella ornata]KAF2272981.1 hypothetical protein EI97DRAFT_191694 [Westerdykella ornata]
MRGQMQRKKTPGEKKEECHHLSERPAAHHPLDDMLCTADCTAVPASVPCVVFELFVSRALCSSHPVVLPSGVPKASKQASEGSAHLGSSSFRGGARIRIIFIFKNVPGRCAATLQPQSRPALWTDPLGPRDCCCPNPYIPTYPRSQTQQGISHSQHTPTQLAPLDFAPLPYRSLS